MVDSASYPTARIGENSFAYRPLGLGYANLGAMLMSLGLPYDSEAGRATAAAVTALMCGEAYATSARCARDHGGPFAAFPENRAPMLEVIARHRLHAEALPEDLVPRSLLTAARDAWRQAEDLGGQHGIRNSQVTVLAPTGTIAFMMDCDTTVIEPDLALVKYKKLVGGGMFKIVWTVKHWIGNAIQARLLWSLYRGKSRGILVRVMARAGKRTRCDEKTGEDNQNE